MRGNTSDSIRTTSTGGKIPLGLRSETPVRECLIAYLALFAIRTILPCVCSFRRIVLWCRVSQPLAPYCPVYAHCIRLLVVLLLALFPLRAEYAYP